MFSETESPARIARSLVRSSPGCSRVPVVLPNAWRSINFLTCVNQTAYIRNIAAFSALLSWNRALLGSLRQRLPHRIPPSKEQRRGWQQ